MDALALAYVHSSSWKVLCMSRVLLGMSTICSYLELCYYHTSNKTVVLIQHDNVLALVGFGTRDVVGHAVHQYWLNQYLSSVTASRALAHGLPHNLAAAHRCVGA